MRTTIRRLLPVLVMAALGTASLPVAADGATVTRYHVVDRA